MNQATIFSPIATTLLILVALISAPTQAGLTTTDELINRLKPLVDSAGEFQQSATDNNGEVVQSSRGTFALQKPGKFLWHTIEPFEQLLVSDGTTIWLHDPDLEQVTVKPFSNSQDQLPIRILSGEFELLSTEFTINKSNTPGLYTLVPNEAQSIAEIHILFNEDELSAMSIIDKTQMTTKFEFANRRALTKEDQTAFNFEIPEGADIFHDQ